MKPHSIASLEDLIQENSIDAENENSNNSADNEDNENNSSSNRTNVGSGGVNDEDTANDEDANDSTEDGTDANAHTSRTGVGGELGLVYKRKLKYNYSNRKRKCRTTFTKYQLQILENEFLKSNFISNDKIDAIVEQTSLDSRIIKVG
jgi:hypothetical protein